MRITSLSGMGVLSFDEFKLSISKRVTFIVGPNGAGKSNLARLLALCLHAIGCADGSAHETDRVLAAFLTARHVGSRSPAVVARIGIQLTETAEQELVAEFARAMITGAITHGQQATNMAEIDAWAEAEVTVDKLRPLMEGEIIVGHAGTPDGQWYCAYEFTATGHGEEKHKYEWILLDRQPGVIIVADRPVIGQGRDITTCITGSSDPEPGPAIPVPAGFQLLDLLPLPDLRTTKCHFELSSTPTGSQRQFAGLTRLPLTSPSGGRMVNLATVLGFIFQQALVQTSDTRLLPSGRGGRSSMDLAPVDGAGTRLPEHLLQLKNGDPSERARYQRIRSLFTVFTQGRAFETRLVQQPAQDGQETATAPVPAVWVTVNAATEAKDLAHEIPVEFAGAGAWEALVLASVLGEPSASVAILDEPAVALHPSLQRQLGAYLLTASAQFLVITHSAELLPLADAADVQLIRLDRDNQDATKAWLIDEACRVKMARKLAAKGNERLPFAWRVILCEGQDDVEAVTTLAERMDIDLRRHNIAIADCGSRDNLSDYIWFCAELGLKYLVVMDADSSKPDAARKAQAVRDTFSFHQGEALIEFPENLESTFDVLKQRPSLVPGKIRTLRFTEGMPDPEEVPDEVTALAEAVRHLIR